MNDNIEVSVIIPVYNVEKYLVKCIDSVLAQTLKEIEIILVDDGSVDRSGEICDEYKSKYPDKIQVIHQENAGLGPARNVGLEYARGKYIAFVDSDDWIAHNMYEVLWNKAVTEECDIVLSDIYILNEAASTITYCKLYNGDTTEYISGEKALLEGIYCYVVNKLYKRELIENERFPQLLFEDIPVITKVISKCKRIGYVSKAFYYYNKHEGTLSTKIDIRMLDTIKSESLALQGVDSSCREALLYVIATRNYQNINSERGCFEADLITHLKKYEEEIRSNKYIMNDSAAKKIIKYLEKPIIPLNIYYGNFLEREISTCERKCLESWKDMTLNANIIELNRSNCDINKAPYKVRKACEEGKYDIVEDYFKIRKIYESGGIAFDLNVKINSPIGSVRCYNMFFGFEDNGIIMKGCFGAVPQMSFYQELLYTYEGDEEWCFEVLSERIKNLLKKSYSIECRGWTEKIGNVGIIFSPDVFAYNMQNGRNVCKFYNVNLDEKEEEQYEVIDKKFMNFWSKEKDRFFRERQKEKKDNKESTQKLMAEIKRLKEELEFYKQGILNYENSTCWKITKPLRKIMDMRKK